MASYTGAAMSKTKVVKPILRRFTQSEKNSLDLDRPATEQGFGIYPSDLGSATRSAYDVNTNGGRRGYHNRSTSGASQFSTATAGSGHRAGSFVHPFQQTPRPYTPPLAASHQDSFIASEYGRDSPALPEYDEYNSRATMRSSSTLSNRTNPPSLSYNTTSTLQPLRIKTRSSSPSQLARGHSQSNLNCSVSLRSDDLVSPADTMSPISGIRSSMDKGFRSRSRSDVDTFVHPDTVQEARRKFQAREQAKAEKAAQEEARIVEKRHQRDARREKDGRKSTASDRSRSKRCEVKISRSDLSTNHEKSDQFVSRDYNTVSPQPAPEMGDYTFEPPKRSKTGASTTKKKTHSAWTSFMMWLRTRLLRMGRSSED